MILPVLPRRFGMPLAMQMVAILVCVLLAAQLVTLALTVILPPRPNARWDMAEVAAALMGGNPPARLERRIMRGPPDVAGQGWLVSQSSRDALARRIGRPPQDVILAFYTQLPVGGVAVPSARGSPLALADGMSGGMSALLIAPAHAQAIPGGPPIAGSPGPAGMPGGGFPGGRLPGGGLPGGGLPGRGFPGASFPRNPGQPGTGMPRTTLPGGGSLPAGPGANPGGSGRPTGVGAGSTAPAPGQTTTGLGQGALPGSPFGGRGPFAGPESLGALGRPTGALGPGMSSRIMVMPNLPAINPDAPRTPRAATQNIVGDTGESRTVLPGAAGPVSVKVPLATAPIVLPAQRPVVTAVAAPDAATSAVVTKPEPIPFRRERDSLFELASPPFIEGDFVAAARQADGTWLAVAPRAEAFPNAWQTRVMLWFALSLAIVSPLAWLFVRRIVLPLRDFAVAAEQLGRDPSATILPLSGPAEIGRAANAFNQMRHRLRAFVDDRTAMVGAISHDLRTPLTRLRFRIEDVPDDQRTGLLKEVTEMEAMISQVIGFIRDASTPGPRQRLDFADVIAGSVADWQLVGANVLIESTTHVPVDVDPVGIRRLLANLLENAVKYGESARVRVSLSGGEAVAEIVDAGPGIPEDEFDRAFEPFYRSEAARRSGRTGSGLGLAVCRSIARAHGGDVSFAHGKDGFITRLSVPAAFSSPLRKAA
ncbi:ATP-binding protein [Novosphingobium sp. Leaf2]|uniref:ATP-binding protein n=1 Tax=Novosphingobium sp. Leaf2 TaxID=1735670 RepID=UPI0006F44ECD|nr:ATP-binding protein [Novosphingobium sp. Leaf2]KQM14727.1 histidine kinase [Novosphingobium sp. Leaf2]